MHRRRVNPRSIDSDFRARHGHRFVATFCSGCPGPSRRYDRHGICACYGFLNALRLACISEARKFSDLDVRSFAMAKTIKHSLFFALHRHGLLRSVIEQLQFFFKITNKIEASRNIKGQARLFAPPPATSVSAPQRFPERGGGRRMEWESPRTPMARPLECYGMLMICSMAGWPSVSFVLLLFGCRALRSANSWRCKRTR